MEGKIKVLVIDDAMFMRKAITDILASDPEIEVVDTARNGLEGLEKIRTLNPDVVTLDMDMPVMDGLTSIRHIMVNSPVPIVVLSSLFNNGMITFDALRLGVVDFVPKPSGAISADIETSKKVIIERIKTAASVHLKNLRRVRLDNVLKHDRSSLPADNAALDFLVAMGTNLTGPNTVIRLMSNIPSHMPAAIIVVQETSSKVLPSFVEHFNQHTPWQVTVARHGDVLRPGNCYVHSNENGLRITRRQDGLPAIEILDQSHEPLNLFFSSAAETFGNKAVAVMLSGTGDDGVEGFGKIKERQGTTIAQTFSSCPYPKLPENVIEHQLVDMILDETTMPGAIQSICTCASA